MLIVDGNIGIVSDNMKSFGCDNAQGNGDWRIRIKPQPANHSLRANGH